MRVIIDPIDGSLNAKRGRLPLRAVGRGRRRPHDGRRRVRLRLTTSGPGEEWWARRGEGAWRNGVPLDPDAARAPRPRRPARGAGDRVRRPALGARLRSSRWRRAPTGCARWGRSPSTLCQVAAARFDGHGLAAQRCRGVDAAAGQLIVREAGGLVSFPGCDDPLGRAARRPPSSPRGRRPVARRRCASSSERDPDRDRLDPGREDRRLRRRARRGGPGPRRPRRALAVESERRVTAYTGLAARAAAAPARGDRPPRVGRRPTSRRCAALLDPVLERAGEGLGPLEPAVQARRSAWCSRPRSAWSSATWPSACSASTSWCCSTRPSTAPAATAVRDAQPRPGGAVVRRRGGGVHDLGGAARGHPRASSSRGSRGCTATSPAWSASCCAAPSCGSTPPRKLRLPDGDELKRPGRGAAPRRPHLDRHQRRPSARRSIACRR